MAAIRIDRAQGEGGDAPFHFKSIRKPWRLVARMRSQPLIGALLVAVGVLLLYFLRSLLIKLIVVLVGVIGIIAGIVLILGGLALIFWRRRGWYRVETVGRT